MQKGFTPILVLVGILVIIGIAGGAYFLGKLAILKPSQNSAVISQNPRPTFTPQLTPALQSTPAPDKTANWKTYTDEKYKFSFIYPQDWNIAPEEQEEVLKVLVKGPNKIVLSYVSGPPGVGGMCNDDPNINLGYESINVFDTPLSLFYYGDKSKNFISYAYVIKGETQCPNIAFFDTPAIEGVDASWVETRLGSIHIYYGDEKENSAKEISEFKSVDLAVAKKIISTFKFLPNLTADKNQNDLIENWNTYTNSQLGISFKYPPTGNISDIGNSGNVLYLTNDRNPPYYIFNLKVTGNQQKLTLRQFIDNELTMLRNSKSPGSDTLADKRQASIKDYQNGGIKGLYLRGGTEEDSVDDFIQIVTEYKGRIYTFVIHDGDGAVDEFHKKLIDQILSTFRFDSLP